MKTNIIVDCPACESLDTKIVFTPNKNDWESFRLLSNTKYNGIMNSWSDFLDLNVKQCNRCQHLWHHIQPDFSSLMKMYDSHSIMKKKRSGSTVPNKNIFKSMEKLYKLSVKINKSQPTFLDYGSGSGRFSKAALKAGFDVWSFEPSLKRRNEQENGYITVNILDELNGLKFDVINLEQVLEHVKDPYEIIKSLLPYLKTKSIVRVTTPNLGKYNAKKLWNTFPYDGKKQHDLSPYEHLHGFNSQSLRILLKRLNLSQVKNIHVLVTHPYQLMRFITGIISIKLGATSFIVTLDKEKL